MRIRDRLGWVIAVASLLLWTAGASAQPQHAIPNCAGCHTQQSATQPATPMARALVPAASNPLFLSHPKLTVRKGAYTYTLDTHAGATTYSVTDGNQTISAPVKWIFGANSQTYVLEKDGTFYESLVSYWKPIDALDTTVGDQAITPTTVAEAFGRPLAKSEVTLCFGCHSTDSAQHHELHLDTAVPGVTCARCHTGAAEHALSFSQGHPSAPSQDLRHANPEEISAFCGQCHRTWETVVRNHWTGPMNVRFQPYRLELSKCFDGRDARLSCVACHDPHRDLVRNDRSYDTKCLACHSEGVQLSLGMTAAHPRAPAMKTCPVAKENCVSCHMPKVPLPGGHQTFTDHNIRVVRAGDGYPN